MARVEPLAPLSRFALGTFVVALVACGPRAGAPGGSSQASATVPVTVTGAAPAAATPAASARADGPGAAGAAGAGGGDCAPGFDEAALAVAAGAVADALARRDLAALARHAHPTKGVRFSPYAYVDARADVVLSPARLAGAMADPAERTWGSYDGSGDPIRLTFRRYFERFVYDRDFARAGTYARGRSQRSGNTANNLCEAYPAAAYVEYHVPGADPRFTGMDWASLRLVFEAEGGKAFLVGVVHDEWTI